MKIRNIFATITVLFLVETPVVNAGSKQLIYSGNYDQAVQRVYFINKKLIYSNKNKESLYKVNLEIQINNFVDDRRIVNRVTELFNCSLSKPYIASKHYINSSSSDEGVIYYINPKGEPEDTSMVGDRLAWKYWAVCHNITNVANADLRVLSSKYRYKNNLKTEIKELPTNLKRYLR